MLSISWLILQYHISAYHCNRWMWAELWLEIWWQTWTQTRWSHARVTEMTVTRLWNVQSCVSPITTLADRLKPSTGRRTSFRCRFSVTDSRFPENLYRLGWHTRPISGTSLVSARIFIDNCNICIPKRSGYGHVTVTHITAWRYVSAVYTVVMCPSVCLSVTRRIIIVWKWLNAFMIMKTTPCDSPARYSDLKPKRSAKF